MNCEVYIRNYKVWIVKYEIQSEKYVRYELEMQSMICELCNVEYADYELQNKH